MSQTGRLSGQEPTVLATSWLLKKGFEALAVAVKIFASIMAFALLTQVPVVVLISEEGDAQINPGKAPQLSAILQKWYVVVDIELSLLNVAVCADVIQSLSPDAMGWAATACQRFLRFGHTIAVEPAIIRRRKLVIRAQPFPLLFQRGGSSTTGRLDLLSRIRLIQPQPESQPRRLERRRQS